MVPRSARSTFLTEYVRWPSHKAAPFQALVVHRYAWCQYFFGPCAVRFLVPTEVLTNGPPQWAQRARPVNSRGPLSARVAQDAGREGLAVVARHAVHGPLPAVFVDNHQMRINRA